jgi:phospholipid/cholesterol/gamma-HCH transport system substrate-binding protein
LKISREIKTAILVIASMLLFIWGYSFLKGRDLLSNNNTFYVKYDNVDGLIPSSPVTINGLIVGKVMSIELDDKWNSQVEIQINSEYKITEGSLAELYSPGPIGGKQVAVVPNVKSSKLLKSGDFLVPSIKLGLTEVVSNEIKPIKDKLNDVLGNANTMLVSINEVMDAETKVNLKKSIENLNSVLIELRQAETSVNNMLLENKTKINSTISNLEKTSGNFSKISDSISKANLNQVVKNLEKTLATVDKLLVDMQSGKGTLGKLVKDETLYTNFTKTSKELELLLQDVRLNPTRYVNVSLFGKKNKPYVAPVSDSLPVKQ